MNKYYDYREAVRKDILEYLREYGHDYDGLSREDVEETLYDTLWVEDSVTGNGSGSYTFNTNKAEEYLCGNWDLIQEIVDEFDIDMRKGPEYIDVSIRCYLLGEELNNALDEADELGLIIFDEGRD